MSLYLDTSALIACYLPESISGKVTRAIDASGSVAISDLVEVEMASVVAKMLRSRQISRDTASATLALFSSHLVDGSYRLLAVARRDFVQARRWIAEFDAPLHTLDAIHLAIAHAQKLPLLTADRQLARAAQSVGVAATWVTA